MCVGVSAASAALSVERLSFQSQNTKVLLFFFLIRRRETKTHAMPLRRQLRPFFCSYDSVAARTFFQATFLFFFFWRE